MKQKMKKIKKKTDKLGRVEIFNTLHRLESTCKIVKNSVEKNAFKIIKIPNVWWTVFIGFP